MTEGARSCGSCAMCCKLYDVPEIGKAGSSWCPSCTPGQGCRIYEERPQRCRDFFCLWVLDPAVPDILKPDRAKMIAALDPTTGHILVSVDPANATAWRREPVFSFLKAWSGALLRRGVHVLVRVRKQTHLVLPDDAVALGEMSIDRGFRVFRRPDGAYDVVPDA